MDDGDDDDAAAASGAADDPARTSKSRRKRDAAAVHALGRRLAELKPSSRAALPLDTDLRDALDALDRIRAHGARKRQLAYLAKRLRASDTAPLETALARLDDDARASAARHHRAELWRERLLGVEPGLEPAAALTACLDAYPMLERQRLRQLQRRALAERGTEAPPRAARALFRLLRDAEDAATADDAPSTAP